jgi:molybdate/tungstate transport system substrate-binding protein
MQIKVLISIVLAYTLLSSCNNNSSDKLIIFHAGSLSVPFKEIVEEFKKENPDVKVEIEAAGSRNSARKISDLKKPCDIMASADYKVIENILMPEFADWYINFAGNEMIIAFTNESRYSNTINEKNWFEILLKGDVAYGRSDPNADPCGYRTEICVKLAEMYYDIPNLALSILNKDKNNIRPKETDLLGLLESKAIDYVFIYKSVALQHQLRYITLPDSINLKRPDLDDYYFLSSTEVSGKKPGETIIQNGRSMIYAVTIVKNAVNPEIALKFLDFLLDKEKGMKIMKKNGQHSLVPSYSSFYELIPASLKKYTKKTD